MTDITISYTLDEDEIKKFEEWKEHIKSIYGHYGVFKYIITPTGIGTCFEVYSELTKTTLDLTDETKW